MIIKSKQKQLLIDPDIETPELEDLWPPDQI